MKVTDYSNYCLKVAKKGDFGSKIGVVLLKLAQSGVLINSGVLSIWIWYGIPSKV